MLIRKVDKRIQQYLDFLDKNKYSTLLSPEVLNGETDEYNYSVPTNLETHKISFPYKYGKEKCNHWFFINFEIPEEFKNEEVYLHAPTGADSLVFINGNPVGAVNPFHLKIKISNEEKNKPIAVAIEAYAGHVIPGYHPEHKPRILLTLNQQIASYPIIFPSCEVVIKNKLIYKLYYDVLVLYDIASQLDSDSLRRNQIIRDLYYALIEIHVVSDQKTLEQEVSVAEKKIQVLLLKYNSSTTPKIFAIGHAHIDHAWLWPLSETVRKVARTFSNMTRLAEEYPDFIFIQSQPAQLEFMKEKYPFIYQNVIKSYKKGQWEPNGGMYVEADTNIPSGESLIRQFLIGKKLTKEYFDYYGDTLWLPDVFGYSGNLPQILKGCGIDYFVTSKINWNDTTRFPYDTFNWSGIDGTIIKSHFLTTSYEGFISVKSLYETWNRIQHKEVQVGLVKPFGEGDGGGGPTRADNEVIKRLADLEGSPKAKWSKVSNSLKEIFATAQHLPTWQGELYLELHRGTYTTIANTKKYNRLIEQLLRNVEFFSVLCTPEVRTMLDFETGTKYNNELINNLWKKLLTHQFHDIIPGSSINQVNAEALATYKSVVEDIRKLFVTLQEFYLSETPQKSESNHFLAFNSLSWSRLSLITIPVLALSSDRYTLNSKDSLGQCQPYIDFENTKHLKALVNLPALAGTEFFIAKGSTEQSNPFIWNNSVLETPYYSVTFNRSMQIQHLTLLNDEFNFVASEQFFNTFQFAEDMPVTWDAWDIEWDTFNHKIQDLQAVKTEVLSTGPLFFQIRYHYSFSTSELVQDVIFYAHDERIDFVTKVNWIESHKVLRVIFPTTIFSDQVTCEIQNGYVKRSTLQNRDHERAMFEICAHKWITLDDPQRGLALLNDSKYGHNVTRNQLGLTLLRAPKHPDEYADLGEHSFTYAIIPYCKKPLIKIIQKSYELNNNTIIFQGSLPSDKLEKAPFSIKNSNIIVESIKYAEYKQGWIIRLYEPTGSYNKTEITFYKKINNVYEVNMIEEHEQLLSSNNSEIILSFTPFQCRTLLIF